MVITNNKKLDKKVCHLKGQGLAENREYWHDIIGYNYRMTNICASIGYAQLEKINEIIFKKEQIAEWYKEELKNAPISFHKNKGNIRHTYWMCSILVNNPSDKTPLREHLRKQGIETRPLFNPIHLMEKYEGKKGDFPIAENLASKGISLPSYPELTKEDIHNIGNAINNYYG